MMDDLALIENMIDRARKGRCFSSQASAVYDALLDDLARLHKRLAGEPAATTVDRVSRELAKHPASPPPMVLMYGNEAVALTDDLVEVR